MLTKKEWIAVAIVLIVVIGFLGSRFLNQKSEIVTPPILLDDIGTNLATTTINNIDINNNQNKVTTTEKLKDLVIKDVVIGTGAEAKAGNLVSVQYAGKLVDGKVFDSSIPRGQPIEFTLGVGQVIPGWDTGILGMKVGGKRTLAIPSTLAYGANAIPAAGIPANADLYFDVELVGVKVQ